MPELKFSAADTSLAMEEVQRKLGPDALILSTQRRDGMIEIVATNDPEQVEAAGNVQCLRKSIRRAEIRSWNLRWSRVRWIITRFSEIIDVETAKYEDAKLSPDDMDASCRCYRTGHYMNRNLKLLANLI